MTESNKPEGQAPFNMMERKADLRRQYETLPDDELGRIVSDINAAAVEIAAAQELIDERKTARGWNPKMDPGSLED